MSYPDRFFDGRDGSITSESFSEGHPDKVCDYIADSILDAFLEKDPRSRVACDVFCNRSHVILGGEITSRVRVNVEEVAREAIREIGYTDPQTHFHADGVMIQNMIETQAPDIAMEGLDSHDDIATNHGMIFGFAARETPELMPLAIALAHRITRDLARARKSRAALWLRPDSKAQVTVRYENGEPVEVTEVVVATQHSSGAPLAEIRDSIGKRLLPETLGAWWRPKIRTLIYPFEEFAAGSPEESYGVSGRKTISDTYGGYARHGGGVFSGRDATKFDRGAACFARFVARQIVQRGLAKRAEIQIAYVIGMAQPAAMHVETFGTGDPNLAERYARQFDFRPAAFIRRLGLQRPVYRTTTNYGHFGKPGLKWER